MSVKKIILLIIFILVCYTSISYGLFFNSPSLLEPKEVFFSLSPYYAANNNWGIYVMNTLGIIKRLNSNIKLGYDHYLTDELYIGIEAKILLFESFGGTDNFSLNLGGHYRKKSGLDLGMSFGNEYNRFENYIGLDFDIEFIDKKVEYPGDLVLGIKTYLFSYNNTLSIEGGIPITSYSDYKLGISIQYKF